MLYMRPGRLLMYFGIITVFIAYVLHDTQGYRLKKTYKHKTSHGKFVESLYGKHNRDTLQSKTDKHKSKRIKTKPTIVDPKPIQMKAITGSTGRKPVVMEPKSNKAVPLKPVVPKRKKITAKPKSELDPGIKVYNCPNEAVQMNCLSCKTKVYRKCPVVGASLVTAVKFFHHMTITQNGDTNAGERKTNINCIVCCSKSTRPIRFSEMYVESNEGQLCSEIGVEQLAQYEHKEKLQTESIQRNHAL